MLDDLQLPARKVVKDTWQFVGTNIRQKSQLAQIYGDDGQLPLSHLVCRPENRAIAAEDDGQIGDCSRKRRSGRYSLRPRSRRVG